MPGSCFLGRELRCFSTMPAKSGVTDRELNQMLVYGRRSSINVQKVLWALGELGIAFERESIGGSFGGNDTPAYRAMNPNGLVPVLRDGDVVMFESNAIVRYLATRYGTGTLLPTEPRALAAAEQWMEWTATTLAP